MRAVVLADGVRLAVHEQGAGTPVVLLHAWGETHRSFDRLVDLLPAELRLLVPDQRGVGESDKPPAGYGLEECAADVIGVMDGMGLAAACVVGTSSGGYVAQQVALSYPSRVLRLVLVGAPRSLAGLDPFGEALRSFHDPVTLVDIAALNDALRVPISVPRGFLEVQDAAALTIPRHVWMASYRGLVEAAAPSEVGSIRVPTLVISGAEDDLIPPSETAALAASIPGSRRRVYAETGHFVLWQRPERVAQDIVWFLRESGDALDVQS